MVAVVTVLLKAALISECVPLGAMQLTRQHLDQVHRYAAATLSVTLSLPSHRDTGLVRLHLRLPGRLPMASAQDRLFLGVLEYGAQGCTSDPR